MTLNGQQHSRGFAARPAHSIGIEAVLLRPRAPHGHRKVDLGTIAFYSRDQRERARWARDRLFRGDPRSFTRLTQEAGGRVAQALRDLGRDESAITTVTNTGLALITNRFKSVGAAEPVFIGWGTGTGQDAADTALAAEKHTDLSATSGADNRTTGTSSQQTTTETNDTYRVTGTRTASGSGTVTEAGLFNDNDIAAGTMFVYGDFSGIALVSGDSIAFTFNVAFAQA